MLVYRSDLIDKIFRQQKTQLRRTVAGGHAGAAPKPPFAVGDRPLLHRQLRPTELTEAERSAVENHDAKLPSVLIGTVGITEVRTERLGDITADDARREGRRNVRDFKTNWVRARSPRWVEQLGEMPVDELLARLVQRFDTRWAGAPVWVVSFELVASTILLAAEPGRAGDYVLAAFDHRGDRIAMNDELEAVDPAIIDGWEKDENSTHRRIKDSITARRQTGADHRELDRKLLSLEDRAVRAHQVARASSINVSSELRAFEAAKAKHKPPSTLEQRCRAIESKAFREGDRDAA